MATPIVITYRYLGQDPEGVAQESAGSHYYFRCLPPFQPAEDDDETKALAAGRDEVFPGAFSGWGERFPSSFPAEQLAGLSTLDGLIEELTSVRGRTTSSE
jgi:hypothetical protein